MSRRRLEPEAITKVVEEQRRHVNQAVDGVEDTPVARDGRAHVLDPQVTLDEADDQVAQLPADADDQADHETVLSLEMRECEAQGPRQETGYRQGAGGTFPG